MSDKINRKGVWGWMLFDWANQPFHTLVLTFIFAPYFVASVTSDAASGQALWGLITGSAGLAIALLAPVLGAVADQSGARKPWIFGFSIFYVIGCLGLWLAVPGLDDLTLVIGAFVMAFVAQEFTIIFTNAMLPDLGPRREIGRISGSGWALGYLGGVLSLIIVLTLMVPNSGGEVTLIGITPILGLDPSMGEPARATGPLSAIWYVIFVIPLFLFCPDAPRRAGIKGALGKGLAQLRNTLRNLPAHGSLMWYLIASMIYRDAMAALIFFGGIYAAGVLGWQAMDLGIFGILVALTGAVGAWVGGRADRRYGPKPVVLTAIGGLILASIIIVTTSRTSVLFLPVAAGSGLPDLTFYLCGAIIGAGAGSLQAASRTLLIHHAEARVPMTEAFGLYALSGKATAFIGPFLIGWVTLATGSQQIGITPVIALFALGFGLLYLVKDPSEG